MANNNSAVCEAILDYFKANPDSKVRPLSLSNELNLDANEVEVVLKKCKRFFVYLPTEQAYKLNMMSQYRGDVVMMKINIEDALKEKNFFQRQWYLIILTLLVVATLVMLNELT